MTNTSAASDVASMNNKFCYVYVLFSLKDKGLYIGYSEDLKKRIVEHNRGGVISTRDRKPLALIHYEAYLNTKDSKAREKFLKSGFGRRELKKSIKNHLVELHCQSFAEH